MKMSPCPLGRGRLTGVFPEKLRGPIQYDEALIAIVVVLSVYGAVSAKRIQQILRGMYNIQLSTGTIQTMLKDCAALVRPTVELDSRRSNKILDLHDNPPEAWGRRDRR